MSTYFWEEGIGWNVCGGRGQGTCMEEERLFQAVSTTPKEARVAERTWRVRGGREELISSTDHIKNSSDEFSKVRKGKKGSQGKKQGLRFLHEQRES